MKHDVNNRIIEVMKTLGVDEADVASAIGKDKSTVYRIVSKATIPSKTTVKLIADAYGLDYHFLMTGKVQQNAKTKQDESPWKDEAYTRLKSDMEYLKASYDKVLTRLLEGGNLGKSKASGAYAGLLKHSNRPEVRVN